MYGNNGTVGSAGNQSIGGSINASGVYKAVFTGDGDAGDTFTLYELPSASDGDWDDTSTEVTSVTIGGSLNPDETNIMPFIIPRAGGSQRFIALRIQ